MTYGQLVKDQTIVKIDVNLQISMNTPYGVPMAFKC